MAAERTKGRGDWTAAHGRSNSSALYLKIVAEVERMIRDSAYHLLAGRAEMTARLIVSQLAHKHGLRPPTKPRAR